MRHVRGAVHVQDARESIALSTQSSLPKTQAAGSARARGGGMSRRENVTHAHAWDKGGGRASEVPISPGGTEDPFEDATLAPNRRDISAHLYALFPPKFVHAYPDAWIEIAYGDPAIEEGKINEARHFSAFDLEQAVDFAEQQNRKGLNVYVGAALRHGETGPSGRAKGGNVLAASHAWCEYDDAGDDARIEQLLISKDLKPSLVVTTGTIPCPRRHLYFRLTAAATPNEVGAANAALKQLLATDNVNNTDRVLRLAGTVSYPPPKKKVDGYVAELVTLHQPHESRAHSLDELIGAAPGEQRSKRGFGETEEKPASTVESFFKDVNTLALVRITHWIRPLFGDLVKLHASTGCWRTNPDANKVLPGRADLEEAISISQRGVFDFGFEKPSSPIDLVIAYGPQPSAITGPTSPADAARWLCDQMQIDPAALGWGKERKGDKPDEGGKPNREIPHKLSEWLKRDLPPPERIMGEWLTKTSRVLISAPTGLGKTNFVMALGAHAAAGHDFLHWKAHGGFRVLYFDGEMSRQLLKERAADVVRRLGVAPETFYLLSHEDIPDHQPLNTPAGKEFILNFIEKIGGVDLGIFDNVMALTAGDMKDEVAWQETLPLVMEVTKDNIGQIWVHHTGHDQTRSYGTKTREWRLDTVALLTEEKRPDTDVSFGLTFTKARARRPNTRADFEDVTIALVNDQWTGTGAPDRKAELSPNAARFLDALHNAFSESEKVKFQSWSAITMDAWETECVTLGLIDKTKPASERSLMSKYRRELVTKHRIGCNKNLVWLL
jgi:hypothetical protein